MSYKLEAYLVPLSVLEGEQAHKVPGVYYRLNDTLALIPLSGGQGLPIGWPVAASAEATVARVSAEYFGGAGTQKATVWRNGQVIAEDVEVNEALRHLGVVKSGGDEWDTVGLDRYRRTETWASEAIRQKRNRDGLSLDALLRDLRYGSRNAKQQEKVRAAAAHDLAELDDRAAIPHLAGILRDPDQRRIHGAVASALASFGEPGVAELGRALKDKLAEPEPRRRWFRKTAPDPYRFFPIVHALGEAGAASGPYAGDVAVLLRHDDFRPRGDAVRALGEMGPAAAAAVPALTESLGDDESHIRSYAAQALGEIGAAAAPAVGRLTACLDDEAHTVRESAEAALAAIRAALDAE